jgi:hypothetical protein
MVLAIAATLNPSFSLPITGLTAGVGQISDDCFKQPEARFAPENSGRQSVGYHNWRNN